MMRQAEVAREDRASAPAWEEVGIFLTAAPASLMLRNFLGREQPATEPIQSAQRRMRETTGKPRERLIMSLRFCAVSQL